jgi:hypothetical protein
MTPKKQAKSMTGFSSSLNSHSKRLKLDSPSQKEDTLAQIETPPEIQNTTASEKAPEWPGWCTVESEPVGYYIFLILCYGP